jgi:hypothetical protein
MSSLRMLPREVNRDEGSDAFEFVFVFRWW